MFTDVDKCLVYLFNVAAKSPQSVKAIFFSENGKVDCRSIRETEDYDNSRIPTEHITLARNILSRCYGELEQMESLFFLYHYGTLNEYLPQLQLGLSILTGYSESLIAAVVRGYRDGMTHVAELAIAEGLEYKQTEWQCYKTRKKLILLNHNIEKSIEGVLISEGFLSYLSESA